MVKKIIILSLSIVLTAVIVIVGVMGFRIKEATENPVSVFFAEDISVTEIEDQQGSTGDFTKIDLYNNGKAYVKKEKILNIAVLGRDATPVEEEREDGGNTDIMIILAIDVENATVKAISIPRDSVAHLYHYKSKEREDDEFFDKLNSAYSAGGTENTAEFQLANSVKCIQEHINTFGTFDITINNYVEIGLTGLKVLTDNIDGVDVVMNNGIPGVGSTGQTVHLTGETAMTYVRDRHNSGGDTGRVANAQVFVKALAKKLQDQGLKESVPALFNTMLTKELMRTDLTVEEIVALATLLNDINIDSIEMQTPETVDAEDIKDFKDHLEFYYYDYEDFYEQLDSDDNEMESFSELEIKPGDEYDYGLFTDYFSLEEIMINTYYNEIETN